jgi:hypothetical protein
MQSLNDVLVMLTVAEQHRKPVRRDGERGERINRFPVPPEEVVAVLLLHSSKATIGDVYSKPLRKHSFWC